MSTKYEEKDGKTHAPKSIAADNNGFVHHAEAVGEHRDSYGPSGMVDHHSEESLLA